MFRSPCRVQRNCNWTILEFDKHYGWRAGRLFDAWTRTQLCWSKLEMQMRVYLGRSYFDLVETKIVLCLCGSHDFRSVLGPNKWVLSLSYGVKIFAANPKVRAVHDAYACCVLTVQWVPIQNAAKLSCITARPLTPLSGGLSLQRENHQVASIATFLLLVSSTWYVGVVVVSEKVLSFLKKQAPLPIQFNNLSLTYSIYIESLPRTILVHWMFRDITNKTYNQLEHLTLHVDKRQEGR